MAFGTTALLAVVLVGGQGVERLIAEEDASTSLDLALVEDAYRLKEALERETLGLRGYLIGGKPAMLDAADAGHQDFTKAATDLEAVLRGQDARLLADLREAEARQQAVAPRLAALKRAGQTQALARLFTAEGSPSMDRATAAADALVHAQQRRVRANRLDVGELEGHVRGQLAWTAAIAIPIMLLLSAVTAWRLWTPLRELAHAARAISAGRMNVRVPRHHADEFGDVAVAFNTMADEVERNLDRLQGLNAELLRTDRVKDDFLRTVTHELKTPLTAITGFARMIERDRVATLDDRHRHAVEKILGNARRMQRLVEDLLDSTAIRQGALEIAPRPTPYRPLLEEAIAQLQPLATQRGTSLSLTGAVDATPAIDGPRVAQVLSNLLSNALKFTPPGGHVSLKACLDGDMLMTEVQDDGPGIAPEDRARLFVPFGRLDHEASGTGLGLSICQAIVQAHGGAIGQQDAPGGGALFWFKLPPG